MARYNDREPDSILATLNGVGVNLQCAHRPRIFVASFEARDLRTELCEVLWNGEHDNMVLVSLTGAYGFTDWNDDRMRRG